MLNVFHNYFAIHELQLVGSKKFSCNYTCTLVVIMDLDTELTTPCNLLTKLHGAVDFSSASRFVITIKSTIVIT